MRFAALMILASGSEETNCCNELLQRFSALRILNYQDQVDHGDYFRDRRMPVLRFVAEKAVD